MMREQQQRNRANDESTFEQPATMAKKKRVQRFQHELKEEHEAARMAAPRQEHET